jgi:hypothetical protein
VSGDVPGYVEVECRDGWDQAAEELIQKLRDAGVEEGQAWMGGSRIGMVNHQEWGLTKKDRNLNHL